MSELIIALDAIGVDTKSALARMLNKEEMYKKFLTKFKADQSLEKLKEILSENGECTAENRAEIFNLTHTIKGVAGNLGLTGIYEASGDLCEMTRSDDSNRTYFAESYAKLLDAYNELMEVLDKFL
jgi:HPt (histidine-containing phosphotransfer) domain-containing protein